MPVKIDIIILSYGKTDDLLALTKNCIESLLASEDPDKIRFNILVIESNKKLAPYQYPGTTTIYPNARFGFNKFLNIGINATNNKYICLCNNDLVFQKNWASELLNFADELNTDTIVLSPFCNTSHRYFLELKEPIKGYFGYFAGHCFFTNRKTLDVIGHLDERINFWYADMDFINLMSKNNIPHYLVPQSKVSHLVSKVTASLSKTDTLKYTYYPYIYFQYKWNNKNRFLYAKRLIKYLIKYCLYYSQDKLRANALNR